MKLSDLAKVKRFSSKIVRLTPEQKKRVFPVYDAEKMKNWITRGEVAKRAGITVGAVKYQEGHQLFPAINEKGVSYFDPNDIEEFILSRLSKKQKEQSKGSIAANIFTLFEKGYDIPSIVVATKQEPSYIRELYREYKTPLGKDVPGDPIEEKKKADIEHKKAIDDLDKQITKK